VIVPAGLRAEYYESLCASDSEDLAGIFRSCVRDFLREMSPADAKTFASQVGLS
jgi:hypothetical protein